MDAIRPSRVVITSVRPEIECGRFPIKRTPGEAVEVSADIFADGHEMLAAVLRYRRRGAGEWREIRMADLGNDLWRGTFTVEATGFWEYSVHAWVDRYATWSRDLRKKHDAGQDVSSELLEGVELVSKAAEQAPGNDAVRLRRAAGVIATGGLAADERVAAALEARLASLMDAYATRTDAAEYGPLAAWVDRERARFSAWYEMFPRSCSGDANRHGTFQDAERRLPYVASMGFDVLYLPPIHPIGHTHRKGKNNNRVAQPGDAGSPWAIGAREGGHKAIHRELGTLEDFHRFTARAREHGLEVALDIAFQCTPDHPYVREHPEWFRHRPDGTIKYAENPPKKYEDIYPLDFENENWRELWQELKSVFEYWCEQGIRIFRVDNPHTKPFAFWEWVIWQIKDKYPDTIFLAEAFTRPKVMYRLAKLGFTQSYTYFAWRNTKWELTEYFNELTKTQIREFFRPNLWPNTPDILTEFMEEGGRPAFMSRLVLAATLGASYGIYGPAYELQVNRRLTPDKEEYVDSEKYEIKVWDTGRADSLAGLIGQVNRIRRDNRALQFDESVHFHGTDNDHLIAYSKHTPDRSNVVLVVVNLDHRWKQTGFTGLALDVLGVRDGRPFEVHDLLTGARYTWQGPRNYVELDPHRLPAHIFRVTQ